MGMSMSVSTSMSMSMSGVDGLLPICELEQVLPSDMSPMPCMLCLGCSERYVLTPWARCSGWACQDLSGLHHGVNPCRINTPDPDAVTLTHCCLILCFQVF